MGDELGKVKYLLAGMMLLAVSGYFGFDELSYFVNGKEASATVTQVTDMSRRTRTGEQTYRQVDISFVEANGTVRTGELELSANWTLPPNGVVQIRYMPGID